MLRMSCKPLWACPTILGILFAASTASLAEIPITSQAETAPTTRQIETVPTITQIETAPTTSQAETGPITRQAETVSPIKPLAQTPTVSDLSNPQPKKLTKPNKAKKGLAQVTSVSQLSDVQPTSWAFQAVQSLVERYGCIEGYPDQTFRGNRAATRYELAAALNACLNQISAQLGGLTAEDLATIKRLQDEFTAELATLRGRVDVLEARTDELEANQFSTTTKFTANVFFNVTGAFLDGPLLAEGQDAFRTQVRTADPLLRVIDEDTNVTFSNYIFLNFNTSFSGKDSLVVQLAAGNGNSPANSYVSAGLFNTWGVPFTDQEGGPGDANTVVLRELFYSFPVNDTVQLVAGARVNWYRYFDNNQFTFYQTGASSFNSGGSTLLNAIDRGAGAVILWDITDELVLKAAYLAENTEFLPNPPFNSASRTNEGLFAPTNTITAELTYSPSDRATLRFLYNRSNIRAIAGQVGGAIGEPIYGFVDDGFDGPIDNVSADTVEFNFDWLITEGFGIFGRYTYATANIDPLTPGLPSGDVNIQAFQAGVAFPDLLREGALLTLSYVRPFDVLDGNTYLVSGFGDGGTQYDLEATYYIPVNDFVSIVPAFYAIFNPNNFSDNPTVYVTNLRTQFNF